ncbi:hypothetical protein [Coxiella burnetii]|uniref:hypothetical protein n=1 Tax=Coxiella burnetii TaxID=777 RepID=UPI000183CEF7|nr:hypothetical protein [Coxiella burnetii]ACJ18897.1 hypothetical exported protein [Coxiella burnetii CbuG_Q212]ATN67259.1 hypothetical protein AYM17_07880 [Coxiella burnetii]OYK85734.1 hypothetical protein CbuQ229_08165 [Coxiella burnetii]
MRLLKYLIVTSSIVSMTMLSSLAIAVSPSPILPSNYLVCFANATDVPLTIKVSLRSRTPLQLINQTVEPHNMMKCVAKGSWVAKGGREARDIELYAIIGDDSGPRPVFTVNEVLPGGPAFTKAQPPTITTSDGKTYRAFAMDEPGSGFGIYAGLFSTTK